MRNRGLLLTGILNLMNYYVYIVRCSDNTLYTGTASNLEKRVADHNESKRGAHYTKSRRPVVLVYSEDCKTRSDALKREYKLKQLSRKEKLDLIRKQKKRKTITGDSKVS